MAKVQPRPVAPPASPDDLSDFSAVLQSNLEELFQVAHEHPVRTTLPGVNDGRQGDVVLTDDGTTARICFKTQRGWFAVTGTAV